MVKPSVGRVARSKNAASPIVAVKTATIAPKLAWPFVNWVTTIIAPPHPGRVPKTAAKNISNTGDLALK
jgi:hypothetical protein